MGTMLLWIEALAAAVLLFAVPLVLLLRIESPWGRRLLVPVGLLLGIPAVLPMLLVNIFELSSAWPQQWWWFGAILWACSYLALATVLGVVGSRRVGDPPRLAAADWPVSWFLLGMVVCVGLMLATLTSMDTAAQIQLASLRAEAASLAHIAVPARPADADNAAPLYQQAFETLQFDRLSTRRRLWLENPRKADLNDADLIDFLENSQQSIFLLERASRRPTCFFVHSHYARADMLVPELELMRNGARLLALDARWQAAQGQNLAALRDVAILRRMAHHACDEPYLMSFLVSAAIDGIAFQTLDEILSCHPENAKALEQLAQISSPLYRQVLQRALQMEQAMVLTVFADLSIGDTDGATVLSEPSWRPPGLLVSFWRIFLLPEDLASYRGLMSRDIGQLGRPYPDEPRPAQAVPPTGLITRMLYPALEKMPDNAARADAWERVMDTAVAVARFNLAEQKYPEQLDQLVPRFLPYVPIDPFSGKPLRLKKRGTGCVVYSIGTNRVDDDGTVDAQQPWTGDVVIRIGTDVKKNED
ncbi:MAG: hypothetical protein AB7K24_04440 [Gemmataceae bacterium]